MISPMKSWTVPEVETQLYLALQHVEWSEQVAEKEQVHLAQASATSTQAALCVAHVAPWVAHDHNWTRQRHCAQCQRATRDADDAQHHDSDSTHDACLSLSHGLLFAPRHECGVSEAVS